MLVMWCRDALCDANVAVDNDILKVMYYVDVTCGTIITDAYSGDLSREAATGDKEMIYMFISV